MISPVPKAYEPRVFQPLTFHDAVERFRERLLSTEGVLRED
jgi:hypothetical protein